MMPGLLALDALSDLVVHVVVAPVHLLTNARRLQQEAAAAV
jgi:hypothetical protein